jgi:hypothetical protein
MLRHGHAATEGQARDMTTVRSLAGYRSWIVCYIAEEIGYR